MSESKRMSDRKSMQWSPAVYKSAAYLAREACNEMLSRLDFMTVNPKVIVDAGCGMGELASALAVKYPDAKIYAVDVSEDMLAHAQQSEKIIYRREDAAKLSFPNHSVDLICANFLLPWADDADACLREWRRVLSPDGLLMVSVLGPDTLRDVPVDNKPSLVDMHDLGDALVNAGFMEPVMDTCQIDVNYRDRERMQAELHASGLLRDKNIPEEVPLHVTFEVIYGHAFAPLAAGFKPDVDGLIRIPLDSLRKTRV
jgi:malonyl-CoA O-methyltransferase